MSENHQRKIQIIKEKIKAGKYNVPTSDVVESIIRHVKKSRDVGIQRDPDSFSGKK